MGGSARDGRAPRRGSSPGVAVVELLGTELAVLSAAEAVSVAGEPPIEFVGQLPDEGELEHPADEPAARKNAKQILDRLGPLRGASTRSDELNGLRVRFGGNPGKARLNAGVL